MKAISSSSNGADVCPAGPFELTFVVLSLFISSACSVVGLRLFDAADSAPSLKYSAAVSLVSVGFALILALRLLLRVRRSGHRSTRVRDAVGIPRTEVIERTGPLMAMQQDIRRALNANQFRLVYQPRIDIKTKTIVATEALLRWQHPKRGLVRAEEFLSAAEPSGSIVELGIWVLKQSCLFARRLRAVNNGPIRVSVNVSAALFRTPGFVEAVADILKGTELNGSNLELELPESSMSGDPKKVARTLSNLRSLGVVLSVDDFGTGYSGLHHLQQFPLDYLKIGGSFVTNLLHRENSAVIAKAVTNLAHNLKLKVVAQGVETAAQYEFLAALGCDEAQGFLLGRPMPGEDLLRIVGRLADR